MNILTDSNLKNIPFLILFNKLNTECEKLNEEFRNVANTLNNTLINTQYINFESSINEINLGIEWLCEVMKPI